ncbi:hypothetical protein B4Q13_19575 [Lacticaseibacillus rhamnosus]
MPAKSGICVLVIDDNPGSLELLETALAHPEIELLTASDPEQGLDLVAGADRQGVGENLQDHLDVTVQFECTQPITFYIFSKPLKQLQTGMQYTFFKSGAAVGKLLPYFAQPNQPIRLVKRQRLQQDAIHNGKNRGGRAEGEGQCGPHDGYPHPGLALQRERR